MIGKSGGRLREHLAAENRVESASNGIDRRNEKEEPLS